MKKRRIRELVASVLAMAALVGTFAMISYIQQTASLGIGDVIATFAMIGLFGIFSRLSGMWDTSVEREKNK